MAVPTKAPERACLLTAPARMKSRYHLLELTPDLVHLFEAKTKSDGRHKRRREGDGSDEQKEGQQRPALCIKGRQNDEAVLCTDTHSYLVRQVTQSNSLLICTLGSASSGRRNEELCGQGAVTVQENAADILEIVPMVARTGRLTTLLRESAYAGEEADREEVETMKRYTPQQVASIVQASAEELRAGLLSEYIVEMDGYHRMISRPYLAEALRVVLAHVERLTLSPERVLLGPAVAALMAVHNMRKDVARTMLSEWFGRKIESPLGEPTAVALDTKAITRCLGLQLLKAEAQVQPLELGVFLRRWRDMAGPSLEEKVDVNVLLGNFLMLPAPPVQPTALQPASIQYFASSDLSLDAAARFQSLFTVRAQWTADDLSPFLTEVAIDKKRRDALLLKFARTSQVQVAVPESKQERRARLVNGKLHAPMRNVQLYSSRLRYQ